MITIVISYQGYYKKCKSLYYTCCKYILYAMCKMTFYSITLHFHQASSPVTLKGCFWSASNYFRCSIRKALLWCGVILKEIWQEFCQALVWMHAKIHLFIMQMLLSKLTYKWGTIQAKFHLSQIQEVTYKCLANDFFFLRER